MEGVKPGVVARGTNHTRGKGAVVRIAVGVLRVVGVVVGVKGVKGVYSPREGCC